MGGSELFDAIHEFEQRPPSPGSPWACASERMGATELQKAVRAVLVGGGAAFDKRRTVRDLVRAEILSRGFLCQSPDGRGFYFHKPTRRLFDLEQKAFQHLLSGICDLSATETAFRFILDSLQTEAAQKRPVAIHTFSFYDQTSGLVAVSDGGGGVWRRERGGKWTSGFNGDDGVLFITEPDTVPWVPEFQSSGSLAWFLGRLSLDGNSGLTAEDQQTLFLVYVLQNFFPVLRRTRVIPAFLGPQGSGKTSAMRMLGSLLCGPSFDVTGLIRDREDAFVAAACNRVVLGIDNADSRIPWLEDALAVYATGHRYRLRRLYTTNEEASFEPRAILVISSRDPHFRRPDVSERLLPLHFRRPAKYLPESALFNELASRRGAIMGELLCRVGQLADQISGLELPPMTFRMADFASFGWAVAKGGGQEDEWGQLLERLERAQSRFASDGDSLIEVLRALLQDESTIGPVDVGSLYRRCSSVAESEALPFPRTAQGFGRHLTNIKRVIEVELNAEITEERCAGNKRYITIRGR